MHPTLVLASASPRRQDLLRQAGISEFLVVPANIDETPLKGEKPKKYCLRIALEKAKKIAAQNPKDVILAADTVVALGSRILGKPQDAAEACRFLQLLSGRQHRVYTSIVASFDNKQRVKTVQTFVKFKRITQKEIELHTLSNQWQDKSGGYMIQGYAATFIKSIKGSPSNVIGLPLMETINLLKSYIFIA